VLAALLLAASVAASTLAHHDGTQYWGSSYANICDTTPQSQCIANNTTHSYWYFSGLSQARRDAMSLKFVHWGNNTDINVIPDTVDVYTQQGNLPEVNAYAWGYCGPSASYGGSDASHNRYCQPQIINWNTWSAAANKVNTTNKYRHLACHEVGHTIGLRHRSTTPTTCLKTVALPPSNPNSVVLEVVDGTTEDFNRVNSHY
jgi:hypothetical protein